MPRPMGKRYLPRSGAEQDAFSTWGRRYLCCMYRAGVKAGIKRGYRRRERRAGKKEASDGTRMD